jgi:hypothetical protein
MALSLPRISNDPGSPYRYRNFTSTWNLLCSLIEAAVNEGGTGSGLLAAAFLRNGWLAAQDEEAAIQEPDSPNLTVTLRDGARIVQDGELLTVDGDTVISGAPADAVRYLTLAHTIGEDSGDIWTPDWSHETRPAPGSGVLAKVTTDADSVTEVSTSAADCDLIPELPYLLSLILAGGGGGEGGGEVFWRILRGSSVDPMTIPQFVAAEINARLGVGQGASIIPPEVRDEPMVNVLHALALHQNYHNDAFSDVPPHHAIVVSPGRGAGEWAYDELTDDTLTTMPVDAQAHVFGQVA